MLEEYDKSLIVNSEYMKRIMLIIDNIKSSKLIRSLDGKAIIQISDGEETLNIVNNGNCYSINLEGTNFTSIIGNCGTYYLYKNDKLEVEHKISEQMVESAATKRTIHTKAKDFETFYSYIDDNSEFLPIIVYKNGGEEPTYFIFDKNLANLNNDELSEFITAKREKQDEVKKVKPKLPRNIDDFDYTPYEEENEFLQEYAENLEDNGEEQSNFDEPEIDYDDLEKFERFLENEEIDEYYKNLVVTVDEERVDGFSKAQILQSLDIELSEQDAEFFDITESVDRIIATYENQKLNLTPQKEPSNTESTER